MYKLITHMTFTSRAVAEVQFTSRDDIIRTEDFRVFLQARDGNWYKQHNPILTRPKHFKVTCTFGDQTQSIIDVYTLICLKSLEPLLNVYEKDKLPKTLSLSDKHIIFRIN